VACPGAGTEVSVVDAVSPLGSLHDAGGADAKFDGEDERSVSNVTDSSAPPRSSAAAHTNVVLLTK